MNELSLPSGNKEITSWTEQDAVKAAQTGTFLGEAALQFAKKAKDVGLVEQVVSQILAARRDFVLWWDGQEKDKGGRPGETGNRSVTGLKLDDYGLNKMTVSRWRKKYTEGGAANDEKFEVEKEKTVGKIWRVIDPDTLATKHTGDEESYTPLVYLDSARAVLGEIDLDPASNDMAQQNVCAAMYYTEDDDGLSYNWTGRVWMNPPYTARVINQFIEKLVMHYSAGDVTDAIVLTNNNTDTSWFHLGAAAASAICFTAGRINFLKQDGSTSSPTNGQAFFYLGDDVESFKREFSRHGLVMVKA